MEEEDEEEEEEETAVTGRRSCLVWGYRAGAVKYVQRGTSAAFWCPAERMGEQLSVSEDLDQTLEVLSTFSGKHPCGTQPALAVFFICSASS
ncbi:hypothetical protein GBF38_008752 [Nibea albiflora]|uniref:Uncharacterized protein n=1 Tax=Nibea albiflora TaxID=240163 RepID=A0ACB7EQL9_NIBAL|nr:hypothetical protein GBF38_008752 [Nibea albiflora]